MFTPDFGWGHQLASVFGVVIWVLFCLLAFSVIVALIFLLVRFLLIGTRAAQLYVARHEPPRMMPQPTPPAAPTGESDAPRRPEGATAVRPEDVAETNGTEATATAPTDTTAGYATTRPMPTESLPADTTQAESGPADAAETEQLPRARKPRTTRSPRTPKTPPTTPSE